MSRPLIFVTQRWVARFRQTPVHIHPGGNPGANLKSISHRCYLFEVAFVWELTKETIVLPLGCLQGGGCAGPYPRGCGAFPRV